MLDKIRARKLCARKLCAQFHNKTPRERLAALWEALVVLVGAVVIFVPLAMATVMYLVAMAAAVVDVVFLGRYGVSVVGGLVLGLALDLALRKLWPQWYARNWAFDGHMSWTALACVGLGYAIWRLSEGHLPHPRPANGAHWRRHFGLYEQHPFYSAAQREFMRVGRVIREA